MFRSNPFKHVYPFIARILVLIPIILSTTLLPNHTQTAAIAQNINFVLPDGFTQEVLTDKLDGPTSFAFAPDGRIFITQKAGTVRVWQNGELLPQNFIDISHEVNQTADRGLLGIAVHPNFPAAPYVYLSYVYEPLEAKGYSDSGARVSRVLRVEADPGNSNVARAGGAFVIVGANGTWEQIGNPDAPDKAPFTCVDENGGPVRDCLPAESTAHTADMLRFGPDGALYVANGDGSVNDAINIRAQDVNSLAGKILRIDPISGNGYANNPFYDGDPGSNRSKVWAFGLRNPFRFTLHPANGELWVGEVGNNVWEEISRGGRGANFGWPCYEGPDQASGNPACQPLFDGSQPVTYAVHAYPHAQGMGAAIGGDFYTGTAYPAQYRNAYFFADYNGGIIQTITYNGGAPSVNLFASNVYGPVQISRGPDGSLYVLSIVLGSLSRIRYGAGPDAPGAVGALPGGNNTVGGSAAPLGASTGGAAAPAPAPAPIRENGAPLAVALAEPAAGRAPLAVTFSAAASSDPDGDRLTYLWNFGDGGTSRLPNREHTYRENGVYTATLTVFDGNGKSNSNAVQISVGNDPPAPQILSPSPDQTYRIGDVVQFSGEASDTEDGPLPADELVWEAVLHHKDHIHYDFYNGAGDSGQLTYEDHGDATYLELCLSARDSTGLEGRQCIDLRAEEVVYTFRTLPEGAPLLYAGSRYVTPFKVTTYVNAQRSLGAPSEPVDGLTFASWSDGGEIRHQLTIGESDQTLIAIYSGASDQLQPNAEVIDINDEPPAADETDVEEPAAEAPAAAAPPAAEAAPASAPAAPPAPQAPVSVAPGGSGQILREYWTGAPGESVAEFRSTISKLGAPAGSELLPAFEGPNDFGDDYAAIVHGYLYPPVSGRYRFWIAGDDSAELWLSSDESPANVAIIASVPQWTRQREWDKYEAQQSGLIPLEAGQRYYILAYHKEASQKDNLSVGWQIPGGPRGILEGQYLSPPE
ncbi:MAG: PQQ-dependent sugar dehydrogenase [Caldilineaceae bacterium]